MLKIRSLFFSIDIRVILLVLTLFFPVLNSAQSISKTEEIVLIFYSFLGNGVQETCIHEIRVPDAVGAENKVTEIGSWPDQGAEGESVDSSGDCISEKRSEDGDHYSSYYKFTITPEMQVQTLRMFLAAESGSDTDTYMCLVDANGDIIAENDDGSLGLSGPNGTDSVITEFNIEPGEYTIEATTTLGSNSGFTESIDGGFTVTLQRF